MILVQNFTPNTSNLLLALLYLKGDLNGVGLVDLIYWRKVQIKTSISIFSNIQMATRKKIPKSF